MYALAAGAGSIQPSPSALYPDTPTNGEIGATPALVPVTTGSDGSCGGNYLCAAGTNELSSGYNGPAGLGKPYGVTAFSSSASSQGFSLSASPTSQTVSSGGNTSYTVTVSPSGGFSGTIDLTVTGLPAGTTGSFYPNPASSSSTLSTGTSSSTPAGSYTLTIAGTSGSLTGSTTVTLVLQSPHGHQGHNHAK